MATRSDLLRRLRRLIDDVGNGYSQSAPNFVTDISTQGYADPAIDVLIDGEARLTVHLGLASELTTGNAIARALQNAIRAANPGLPDESVEGFSNCSCRFHRQEGYVLRSGSNGSNSRIQIWPASAGNDVSQALRLGATWGGMETEQQTEFSDEELEDLLDASLQEQNTSGTTQWAYDTLPDGYQTVVCYRAWADVIDMKLGRSAHYFSQKVASEEANPGTMFKNFMELAKWVKGRVDDLLGELESQIVQGHTTVWNRLYNVYTGNNVYKPSENNCRILNVAQADPANSVILEIGELLTPDAKKLFVAYSTQPGVWDQTALTVEDFQDPGSNSPVGLASHATLERTITNLKNTWVKISNLAIGTPYYFALQMTDQNGNRYFSNEFTYTIPE